MVAKGCGEGVAAGQQLDRPLELADVLAALGGAFG
jgi:hypothetical protein